MRDDKPENGGKNRKKTARQPFQRDAKVLQTQGSYDIMKVGIPTGGTFSRKREDVIAKRKPLYDRGRT